MIKALIIEDEAPAARRLEKLLLECDPTIKIVDTIESVEEGIFWLQNNTHPDVIFSDIQLADGVSFLIYEKIMPLCPIVFITAFDQFAIRAFEVNCIDYLLKPFSKEQLEKSLDKLRQLRFKKNAGMQNLMNDLVAKKPKQRFLINKGDSLIPVSTSEIAYIYTEDKAVMLMTKTNKNYFINFSLDEVEQQVDDRYFFRLNRQIIIHIDSIAKISNYFNGKLKVEVNPKFPAEIVVSRAKAPVFKDWLEQ